MSLTQKIVDAFDGHTPALSSLTLELNDTPASKVYCVLHIALRRLHTKYLFFVADLVVQKCNSAAVLALFNVLADMGVVLADTTLLLSLIRRNNMDLMVSVLRHHYVEREIPRLLHKSVVTELLSPDVNTKLGAYVARKFGLSQHLALRLRWAVKQGNVEECLQLIRIGAPLEASAYISAAARNYPAICDLYIDAGFLDVRAQNNKALRVAAARGYLDVCKHIVHVALPRTEIASSKDGDVRFVNELGEKDIGKANEWGRLLSDVGVANEKTRNMVSDIRACNNEAFRFAAGHGHVSVCQLLLSCGLTMQDIRAEHNNALRWTAGSGHLEVCRLLLSFRDMHGNYFTLDDVREYNNEALRMAIRHQHADVAQLLLDFCDPVLGQLLAHDLRAENNYAIRWASGLGMAETCEALVGRGLTLDDIRTNDNEAFRRAARYGCLRVCKFLWNTGLTLADIRSVNNEAFRLAAGHGHLAMCKWLIQCGLTETDASTNNEEGLFYATKNGYTDVCTFLHSLKFLDTRQPKYTRHVTLNFVPTVYVDNFE